MHKNCEEESSLYKNLIDNSIDAVVLVQDRQILLANKAFCKLFGYTKKEVLNSDLSQLLDPQDRERVVTLHYKRMNGEKIPTIIRLVLFINRGEVS
jgi:PAS fold.